MAVSTNHNLGGCVILLRLYLIDIGMKNYRGFQGYSPFHWQLTMPSCLVVKQNFLSTNVIVNYHTLIIHNWSGYGYFNFHSNWQIFVRGLAKIKNKLPYPLLYLRKVCIFLWYFDKNLYFLPKCTAKKIHLDAVIREGDAEHFNVSFSLRIHFRTNVFPSHPLFTCFVLFSSSMRP